MKTTFVVFLFMSVLNIQARSVHPCPNFKPIPKEDIKSFTEILTKDPEFLGLKNSPHDILKFKFPNAICNETYGNVTYHPKPMEFEGKLCRFKNFTFSFEIKDKKVVWRRPERLKTASLFERGALLHNININKVSKNFFKNSNYCYLDLKDDLPNWWVHLRDEKKTFCYLLTNKSGKDISVIKRLYAKDSKCEIYN